MANKKMIIGGIALAVVGVGGYFAYKYFSKSQAVALQQQQRQNTVSTATSLLDAVGKAGGVTGVLGSVFGDIGSLFRGSSTTSVQPDGSTISPDNAAIWDQFAAETGGAMGDGSFTEN